MRGSFLVLSILVVLLATSGFSSDNLSLTITTSKNSIQGVHENIDVVCSGGQREIGGYDLVVAFDASALTLYACDPDLRYFGDNSYKWEYFSYRLLGGVPCGVICPSGNLRVTAIAETNNGSVHPVRYDIREGYKLFSLDFLISDDRTLECTFSPIRFCWYDCDDNRLVSPLLDTEFVSRYVFDYDGTNNTDPVAVGGYPTYGGVLDSGCAPNNPPKLSERSLDFYDGGVDIACAESLSLVDCRISGYWNWYEQPWSDAGIRDMVLFSRYFVYGLAVFNINSECQVAATDVNADGQVLTVADFVYAVRIVTGDALAFPLLDPIDVEFTNHNDSLVVEDSVGAIFVQLEGNVIPTNLSTAQLEYHFDQESNATRILIYAVDKGHEIVGPVLQCTGSLLTIEMATYAAQPVRSVEIRIPDSYELHQNYPNPFNSTTVLSFSLPWRSEYTLSIYNAVGQIVDRKTGIADAGPVRVFWDAGNFASGIYFYRLQVGDYSESRKMVLLK